MKKTTLLILLSTFIISTFYSCSQEESEYARSKKNIQQDIQSEQEYEITPFSDSDVINVSDYSCYKTDTNICKIEASIFRETNAYRQTKGKKALQPNVSVSYIARDWSEQQSKKGAISHDGFPDKRTRFLNSLKENKTLDSQKIKDLSAENVGMEYTPEDKDIGKDFTEKWINSPDHEQNIIDYHGKGYIYLGVGVYKGTNGYYYATQIFAK